MTNESGVTVLTGGAGILGKAMLANFAKNGNKVVILDRDQKAAEAAIELIGSDNFVAYQVDVANKQSLEEAHEKIKRDFGPVTSLVCNAATKSDNFFEPFESFSLEEWEYVMSVNLTGPMLCSQVFGAEMAEAKRGSIVNILSIYGIVAPDQRIYEGSLYEGRSINTPAIYSASKAGLWGLTKYLASYWGASNVRVNAVTPGGVFSGQNQTFENKYNARTMLDRMAKPHEIADAVEFLLSDKASYITGQNLIVDGGLTSW